jgi:lysozyme family protein
MPQYFLDQAEGLLGSKTVNAINSISDNKVPGFIEVLKIERLKGMREMKNWPTAKNGWTIRTNSY